MTQHTDLHDAVRLMSENSVDERFMFRSEDTRSIERINTYAARGNTDASVGDYFAESSHGFHP
jgi:predicted ATPase